MTAPRPTAARIAPEAAERPAPAARPLPESGADTGAGVGSRGRPATPAAAAPPAAAPKAAPPEASDETAEGRRDAARWMSALP